MDTQQAHQSQKFYETKFQIQEGHFRKPSNLMVNDFFHQHNLQVKIPYLLISDLRDHAHRRNSNNKVCHNLNIHRLTEMERRDRKYYRFRTIEAKSPNDHAKISGKILNIHEELQNRTLSNTVRHQVPQIKGSINLRKNSIPTYSFLSQEEKKRLSRHSVSMDLKKSSPGRPPRVGTSVDLSDLPKPTPDQKDWASYVLRRKIPVRTRLSEFNEGDIRIRQCKLSSKAGVRQESTPGQQTISGWNIQEDQQF